MSVRFVTMALILLSSLLLSATVSEGRYIVYDMQKSKELNVPLIKENSRFAVTDVKPPEGVKYEEDKVVHALFTPNDRFIGNQKYLDSIHAKMSWDYITGNDEIVVAVIDTGVNMYHEDLSKNIWVNKDEIPDNGVDDDGNGYVDDYRGYDFVNSDPTPTDDEGHGTHVAGIIAAEMNNLLGIAGISQVKIMPLKVLDENGYGYDSDVAEAIYYAVDNGARVISMSLGGDEYAEVLKDACDYAWRHGVVLVAASGNDGERSIDYPAAFSSVIAVGSVDSKDKLSSFSDFGKEQELVAPGENVYSTYPGNSYAYMSGTSMAAPQVAAVASLILSMNPELSGNDVRNILHTAVDDLGPEGRDEFYGYGKINASKIFDATPLRNSMRVEINSDSAVEVSANPVVFDDGCIVNISWSLNTTAYVEVTDRFGDMLLKKNLSGEGRDVIIFNYNRGGYFIKVAGGGISEKLYVMSLNDGEFSVINITLPKQAYPGELMNAMICVRNNGGGAVYKAGLIVNGSLKDVVERYVNASSTACLNLSYAVKEKGKLAVSINGVFTRNVSVLKPEFNVSFEVHPVEVRVGENVTILTCVENFGNAGGNVTLPLEIDGEIVDNHTLFVEPGAVVCMNYSYVLGYGQHSVRIAFDNLTAVRVTVTGGDLNEDGRVDFNDLITILNLILSGGYDSRADVNGDGSVNFNDLIAVLNLLLSAG